MPELEKWDIIACYPDLWRHRSAVSDYDHDNYCFHAWGEAEVTSLILVKLYLTPEITHQHFSECPSKHAIKLETEIKRFKRKEKQTGKPTA